MSRIELMSVTTTSQIYLALSHWEPQAEEWKTIYTQSRQLSSHLQHKLTRLVFRRIWVQIPAESQIFYIIYQSCGPTSLFVSAYCPLVTPNLWKIEVVRALSLVHSVSTIQLPLQSQQVIRTLLVVFEVLVLSRLRKKPLDSSVLKCVHLIV